MPGQNRAVSARLRELRRALLVTASAGFALGCTPVALAQDASQATGQATAQENGIGDIIVTARKRQETTQDVPVAVVAISAEKMQQYDLSNLERVAAMTPSFSIGRTPSGSGATLVLRGIGSNTTSIGLEQSVAVIVDGAYYGQGRTINEGFFDLGRPISRHLEDMSPAERLLHARANASGQPSGSSSMRAFRELAM